MDVILAAELRRPTLNANAVKANKAFNDLYGTKIANLTNSEIPNEDEEEEEEESNMLKACVERAEKLAEDLGYNDDSSDYGSDNKPPNLSKFLGTHPDIPIALTRNKANGKYGLKEYSEPCLLELNPPTSTQTHTIVEMGDESYDVQGAQKPSFAKCVIQ